MDNLERIAVALEKQNELFGKWIDLNRESIQDALAKRAQIFPHELERMKLEVSQMRKFAYLEEKLAATTKHIDSITDQLMETPAPSPA